MFIYVRWVGMGIKLQEHVRGTNAPVVRFTDSCETHDMTAGDWTQVFCKSTAFSSKLSQISSLLNKLTNYMCSKCIIIDNILNI